jgi:hypothetical protein
MAIHVSAKDDSIAVNSRPPEVFEEEKRSGKAVAHDI